MKERTRCSVAMGDVPAHYPLLDMRSTCSHSSTHPLTKPLLRPERKPLRKPPLRLLTLLLRPLARQGTLLSPSLAISRRPLTRITRIRRRHRRTIRRLRIQTKRRTQPQIRDSRPCNRRRSPSNNPPIRSRKNKSQPLQRRKSRGRQFGAKAGGQRDGSGGRLV
jgi:hypothetical protein